MVHISLWASLHTPVSSCSLSRLHLCVYLISDYVLFYLLSLVFCICFFPFSPYQVSFIELFFSPLISPLSVYSPVFILLRTTVPPLRALVLVPGLLVLFLCFQFVYLLSKQTNIWNIFIEMWIFIRLFSIEWIHYRSKVLEHNFSNFCNWKLCSLMFRLTWNES